MRARKDILPGEAKAHVFFRCHNRSHFFKPNEVKGYILHLWLKYKHKYQIKIHDFGLLDNHAHLTVTAPSAENLGNFMRTTNSQLALFINDYFKRDSQAIRERYKSPLITSFKYLKEVTQYIWLNRFKVHGTDPLKDPWCSASWRFDRSIIRKIAMDEDEAKQLENLLDDDEMMYEGERKKDRRTVRDLLNEALSKLKEKLTDEIYCHAHTLGDKKVVEFREELLSALERVFVPWTPPPDPAGA